MIREYIYNGNLYQFNPEEAPDGAVPIVGSASAATEQEPKAAEPEDAASGPEQEPKAAEPEDAASGPEPKKRTAPSNKSRKAQNK